MSHYNVPHCPLYASFLYLSLSLRTVLCAIFPTASYRTLFRIMSISCTVLRTEITVRYHFGQHLYYSVVALSVPCFLPYRSVNPTVCSVASDASAHRRTFCPTLPSLFQAAFDHEPASEHCAAHSRTVLSQLSLLYSTWHMSAPSNVMYLILTMLYRSVETCFNAPYPHHTVPGSVPRYTVLIRAAVSYLAARRSPRCWT